MAVMVAEAGGGAQRLGSERRMERVQRNPRGQGAPERSGPVPHPGGGYGVRYFAWPPGREGGSQ